MRSRILYFLEGKKKQPFEPHHKCFPVQEGVVGRLQSQHWEVKGKGSEVQRLEVNPNWLLCEFGVSLGYLKPIY